MSLPEENLNPLEHLFCFICKERGKMELVDIVKPFKKRSLCMVRCGACGQLTQRYVNLNKTSKGVYNDPYLEFFDQTKELVYTTFDKNTPVETILRRLRKLIQDTNKKSRVYDYERE